jgi:ribosomal protein S10
MSEIKSLADQLRSRINGQPGPKREKKKSPDMPEILESIRAYDNRQHKSLMHIRFDAQTVQTMNQFKMATGVDVTKLVAFSVQQLFEKHPELKKIIKQYIQQLEL